MVHHWRRFRLSCILSLLNQTIHFAKIFETVILKWRNSWNFRSNWKFWHRVPNRYWKFRQYMLLKLFASIFNKLQLLHWLSQTILKACSWWQFRIFNNFDKISSRVTRREKFKHFTTSCRTLLWIHQFLRVIRSAWAIVLL